MLLLLLLLSTGGLLVTTEAHMSHDLHLVHSERTAFDLNPSVSVSANPLSFTGLAANATVSFSSPGPQPPSFFEGSWVGLYSPSTVDPSKTAPVKWQYLNASEPFHNGAGTGTLEFELVNMREDFIFMVFTGGVDTPVLVGKSSVIANLTPNIPLFPFLIPSPSPGEVGLRWISRKSGTPVVKFGTTKGGPYKHTVYATTTTYHRNQMCGSVAATIGWRDPGFIHTAYMTSLPSSNRFYYIYGDESSGLFGKEETFVSPPLPDAPVSSSHKHRILAYGDLGKAPTFDTREHWIESGAAATQRNLKMEAPHHELAVHIGDISYAVGWASEWDQFEHQMSPVGARMPYATCIGNHERDFPNSGSFYNGTDSFGECGVPYENRYPMPRPGNDQPWYSFEWGPVAFVVMSTEHAFDTKSEQFRFLNTQLSLVNRTRTPWLVLAGHRPMYNNNQWCKGDPQCVGPDLMQKFIEPLLNQYEVDVAIWGHVHNYQRSCPMYQGQCTGRKGTTHVIIGMAGMGLVQDMFEFPRPHYWEYLDDTHYGYTRWEVTYEKFHLEFVGNGQIDGKDRAEGSSQESQGDERRVLDEFTLFK